LAEESDTIENKLHKLQTVVEANDSSFSNGRYPEFVFRTVLFLALVL